MSASKIFITYSIVTIFSILLNIGIQALSIEIYAGHFSIEISMLMGVLVGLPLKFFLEKRLIFFFNSKSLVHDMKVFVLYVVMGVVTTLIFIFVEYVFHVLFMTGFMRYVGAGVGLAIGSLVKYHLDKYFVFKKI